MSEKKNKGGNSDLDGKYWNCPDYVLNCFKNAVKTYESTNKGGGQTEGYKRAKNILQVKMIEYKQMKRMKNWFENFEGDQNDIEYRLNGGSTTRNWVDGTLNRETQAVKGPKKIKSDTGLTNQFLKQHNKDTNKVNKDTLKIRIPKVTKDISGQISRGKPVYEEIIKIKKLITYKSKI